MSDEYYLSDPGPKLAKKCAEGSGMKPEYTYCHECGIVVQVERYSKNTAYICDPCLGAGMQRFGREKKMPQLSQDTLDALTADGIRNLRKTASEDKSAHPADVKANALIVAACDVLLSYLGAGNG